MYNQVYKYRIYELSFGIKIKYIDEFRYKFII